MRAGASNPEPGLYVGRHPPCTACGQRLTAYEAQAERVAKVGGRCVDCTRLDRRPSVPGERSAAEEKEAAEGRILGLPASAIRREPVRWLVPRFVPLGAVTLVAGREGQGKSLRALGWAAELSRGELTGQPEAALYLGAEDAAPRVRARLEAAGADLDRVYVEVEPVGLPDACKLLARSAAEREARLVILDPVGSYVGQGLRMAREEDVRGMLGPLRRLAEEREAAVIVIVHLNKAPGLDPLSRVLGSRAFTGLARQVLLLGADPDDPDGERGRQRILAAAKSNYAEIPPARRLRIEPILLPAADGQPEEVAPRIVDLGPCERSAADLLAPASSEEERSALEEAVDFLQDALAAGPRPSRQVKRAARDAGIEERTLQRARTRLQVQIRSEGFPRETVWALPSLSQSPVRGTPVRSRAMPIGTTGDGTTGTTEENGLVEPNLGEAPSQSCQNPIFGTTGGREGAQAGPAHCHKVAPLIAQKDNDYRLGEPGYEGFLRRRSLEGHLTDAELEARVALHRALRRPERHALGAALAAAAEEARAALACLRAEDRERLLARARAELAGRRAP